MSQISRIYCTAQVFVGMEGKGISPGISRYPSLQHQKLTTIPTLIEFLLTFQQQITTKQNDYRILLLACWLLVIMAVVCVKAEMCAWFFSPFAKRQRHYLTVLLLPRNLRSCVLYKAHRRAHALDRHFLNFVHRLS